MPALRNRVSAKIADRWLCMNLSRLMQKHNGLSAHSAKVYTLVYLLNQPMVRCQAKSAAALL